MTAPWIAAFVALWGVVVLLAVLTLGLLRRVAPALERAERAGAAGHGGPPLDVGPPPGSAVPPVDVAAGDGLRVPFSTVGPNPRVVVFVDEHCQACHSLTEELAATPEAASLPIVVVPGAGTAPDHYRALVEAGFTVVAQPDGAVSAAFAQRAFPLGVAVAADGTVLDVGIPNHLTDLHRLVAALGAPPPPRTQEGARNGPRARTSG